MCIFRFIIIITGIVLVSLVVSCGDVSNGNSYTVSGSFSFQGTPLSGVYCVLKNPSLGSIAVESASDGSFKFEDIWNGDYTLTMSKGGYVFTPAEMKITVFNRNVVIPASKLTVTWTTIIGDSLSNTHVETIIPDGFGGYLCVGSTDRTPLHGLDGYVARIDALGDIVWDKTLGGKYNETFYAVSRTSDDCFYITGYTETDAAGLRDIWIVKIDKNGDLVTAFNGGMVKIGTAGCKYNGMAIVTTNEMGCVVAGSVVTSVSTTMSRIFVEELTSTGGVKWSQTYGNNRWDVANGICRSIDSNNILDGYVITGSRETISGNNDILVMKINPDGSDSGVSPDIIDAGIDDGGCAVTELSGYGFAVTGYVTASNGASDGWVGLYTHGLSRLAADTFGGFLNDKGSAVISLPDGGFAVGGYVASTELSRGDSDFCLRRYLPSGTVSLQNVYDRGNQLDDICRGLALSYDGGFILSGLTSTGVKDNVWIIKTDAFGVVE